MLGEGDSTLAQRHRVLVLLTAESVCVFLLLSVLFDDFSHLPCNVLGPTTAMIMVANWIELVPSAAEKCNV
jgi:hypothetical protein